jgi:hypothetical protein
VGLESYVRATDKRLPKLGFEPQQDLNLQYWRDNWNIHARWARLYKDLGGDDPLFNQSPIRLDMEDICLLEFESLSRSLSKNDSDIFETMDFCELARKYLEKGKNIYYVGSW